MTPEEKKALEEQMNQILFKDFKSFVDSTNIFFAKEYFAFRLNVGNQGYTYALTPFLAKEVMKRLQFLIDLYEKTERPIAGTTASLSPLQQKDLEGPEDKGSSKEDSSDKPND